ncbi:MAG: ATP-dependent RecD-like DNA helicase [Treponema sp.]|nr:ATP-dependent RecD-like DNA helicase [Treponema sp.]
MGSTEKIKGYQYFNKGCAVKAEEWQLLAPVRNMPHGVINLNHIIQQKYRKDFLDLANNSYHIPKRMGPESIVYGDKVICIKNEPREAYPKSKENLNMVANGEIGIAMANWNKTQFLNVEYASQPGITYGYSKRDFGEESEAILELAYALTVHKAQGSEFGTVILVLNEPCLLLSKELLYTAITRQVNKLVILYNKDASNLRDYSNSKYPEIAK